MKSRKKNLVGKRRWDLEIAPVAKFAASHRGFRAALAMRLGERFKAKAKNWRVMLDLWITDNPERRTEPLVGTGIVLLEEAQRLMDSWPE